MKKALLSETLIEKFRKNGVPFKINDNIFDNLHPYDLEYLEKELTSAFELVLDAMLIDRNDSNTMGTPRRLAKMFLYELFAGRYQPKPLTTSFPNNEFSFYDGMVVVKAELKSVCAHHLQPVTGVAYIGILPNQTVLGLSKYIRLAQWCARRGTLQEKLCTDIADELIKSSGSTSVAVHLAMDHGCCTNRGVNAHSALTQTTVLRGLFRSEPGVKEEFFDNVKMQQGIR